MKKANPRDIFLIEDHQEAYYLWKKSPLRKMTLVHFDAHIDFGFHEIKDVPLILNEARTLSELRAQLAKAVLFYRKRFDPEKLTHIGNYIYPAMRDGIINEFYWVVPGKMGEFRKSLSMIKGLLRDLRKEDPFPPDNLPFIESGFVKTSLYGKPFHIFSLDSLPVANGPVLFDIDTDFFVVDSLRSADNIQQIARRKPWIGIEDFVSKVREKIPHPLLTTIAYSVNGGFTPMVYKTLGDRLAMELCCRDQGLLNRLRAGEHFQDFREAFDRKDFLSAQVLFREAVKWNPAYKVPDNCYGPLYFQAGNYRWAEKEWQGMLRVDAEDVHALSGLGKIRLARRKHREAAGFFSAALRFKHDHPASLAGLAQAEYHLKNYKKAQTLITDFERLEPVQGFSRYLLGKIFEKTGRPREALAKYKEALQLGMDDVDLLTRLVSLSKRFERSNMEYLKKRCEDFRKSWLRLEKKNLVKKGKVAEIKRMEERVLKIFALFPVNAGH